MNWSDCFLIFLGYTHMKKIKTHNHLSDNDDHQGDHYDDKKGNESKK